MKHLTNTLIVAGFFLFVFALPAHAYLDPGTGSYVLQMLAAAFFGGLFFISTGWRHIKNFFAGLFGRKDKKKSEKHADKEE